jgi:hypothetical protein
MGGRGIRKRVRGSLSSFVFDPQRFMISRFCLHILAPFDAIHVGAAAPSIPQALIDQLAQPGRMFIPVGEFSQDIIQVDKDENGNVTQKELFGVMVRDCFSLHLPLFPPLLFALFFRRCLLLPWFAHQSQILTDLCSMCH